METAGSKDLEDSLFSPDSHLDWADEVMAEDMNDFSLPKYDGGGGVSAFSTSPNPIQSNGMYHERKDSGRDPRGNKPSSNHNYQTQNQQQQQSGRQSRGSGEYRGRNGQRTAGRTRGGGGGGGRSSSRAGYSSTQHTQQPYTQQPGGPVLQVGSLRTRRGSSDRSVSMERSGSTERGVRGWRSTATAYGRARADLPDRWEHDKFDLSQANPPAPPSVHSRYPGSSGGSSSNNNGRGRERRNSSSATNNEFSASGPVDIEHIGKEGISHVTINRRESNASSRGFGMATSYESPRRLGSLDSAPDDVAGSFRSKPTQPVQQATAFRPKSPSLPSTAALAAPSSGHHPYRAPHKRAGSIDSPEDHTSSGSFPHDTTATIAAAAASVVGTSRSVENSSKGFTRSPVDGDGPSAELEWENFVANGGLEMPFENITDDLLKHPQRQPAGRKQSGSGSKNGHRQKPADKNGNSSSSSSSNAGVAGGDKAAQYASRTMLLLSNDEDQENDDASDSPDRSGPGSREADRPTRGGSGGSSKPSGGGGGGTARKEISIRGTAKPTGASGMASLLGDHASASRPRRPSIPAKKTREPVDPAVGIRIKGTFPDTSSSSASASSSTPGAANGSGSTRTHPAEPSMPSRTTTASPTLRAPTPTKPASPSPSISRSSSTEGRRPAATVPSSYLRRQFEGYDEDRGRHIFSVNVPYDENRYAPIHVHEKDDLAKLAAKFTRTWRLHNKELRIKQLLAKMKSLLIESSL
ncbi:hypothetical protein GGH99_003164 [Coemansia sp. RSA 1285]|nr:hypothetical protein GGH99_003164 [Coemansia sp. RSA 1285]